MSSSLPVDLTWSCGPTDPKAEDLLAGGNVEVLGRMPWSSNATMLAVVTHEDGATLPAIYKPERGERPLWDFPSGLWRREVAAYVVSELLGFGVIPPTVAVDGPIGPGSMQFFVEADYDEHYFTFGEDPALATQLQQLCALDLVINNTDRKAGHLLLSQQRVWGIDNGLSFHLDDKVRTVIWDFGGQQLPNDMLTALTQLDASTLVDSLAAFLSAEEIEATYRRCKSLVHDGVFPIDDSGRGYPWPLV